MNIQEYISSGIVESYVMGLATEQERAEFEKNCSIYSELAEAREAFELSLEKAAFENAIAPITDMKEKILAKILQEENSAKIISINKPFLPTKKMNWMKYAVAACLILLAGSAYWNYSLIKVNNELKSEKENFVTRIADFEKELKKLSFINNTINGYDPKEYFQIVLDKYAQTSSPQQLDTFFKSVDLVGNSRKIKDDAFFRQQSFCFQKDGANYKNKYAFGFYFTFEEKISFEKVKSVTLGADNSVFSIEIDELKGDEISIFDEIEIENSKKDSSKSLKIVLLSDTYIPDYKYFKQNIDFILGGSVVPFQYNTSSITDKDHFNIKRSKEKYQLLERGTVIYPKNTSEVIKLLNQTAFKNIGYNHFRILENN